MVRRVVSLLIVALLASCGDDGDGVVNGVGGAGAGGFGGTAGSAGAAGTVAGSSGTSAGMGGVGGMAGAAGGTAGAAGSTAGSGGLMPTFAPTFGAIYTEIITTTGCNGGSTCHASTIAGNLVMGTRAEAHAALVNVAAMGTTIVGMGPDCKDSAMMRVVPGQPDMSLLVKKIEANETMAAPCGEPMPLTPPRLSAQQIAQIRMWIQMGAMNDG